MRSVPVENAAVDSPRAHRVLRLADGRIET